jgi:hypothetical protein
VDLNKLQPTRVRDVSDARLYHLAGLNISRAWMLEGILSNLPVADARRKPLAELASKLRQAAIIRDNAPEGLRRALEVASGNPGARGADRQQGPQARGERSDLPAAT